MRATSVDQHKCVHQLGAQQKGDGRISCNRAHARVQMMELVELSPLRNLLVGSPAVTGLSVEQRKRLSIAVELISNPAIVLMDEPTSGSINREPSDYHPGSQTVAL